MYCAIKADIGTQQEAKTIHRGAYASGGLASNFATPSSFLDLWQTPFRLYNFVVLGHAPEVIIKPVALAAVVDWVQDAKVKLSAFAKLESDWNGRGSEPPSKEAIQKSEEVLLAFHRLAGC